MNRGVRTVLIEPAFDLDDSINGVRMDQFQPWESGVDHVTTGSTHSDHPSVTS